MDIATKLSDLRDDLRTCRNNIIAKGGEISANAGFSEVAEKILELPSGTSSVGTVIDDSISVFKQVPINSTKYCYLSKLGGYTHEVPDDSTILAPIRLENAKPMGLKVHGANLMPFPYAVADKVVAAGVTFTVNADGSISANGVPTGAFNYTYAKFALPAGTYTCSAKGISKLRSVVSLRTKEGSTFVKNIGDIKGSKTYLTFTISAEEAASANVWINIYNSTGALENETIYPMLNRGTTAQPYKPYRAPVTYTLPESITSLPNLGLGLYDNEYNECDFVNDKYIQRCNTKTFVGTETFNVSALGSRRRYNISVPTDCRFWNGGKYLPKQKCDYLETDTLVDSINKNDTIKNKMTQWQTGWFFYVDGTDFTDLATWQAYLAEHNMEVVYELEEGEVTDIGTSDFNPLIEVEGGGSIEFITDSGYAPNSTVVFQTIL